MAIVSPGQKHSGMPQNMLIAAILFSLISCTFGGQAARGNENSFESVFRPVRDGGEAVTAIEVRSIINGALEPDSGPLSVSAPIVYASVQGIADRVIDLEVSDRHGDISLSREDDPVAAGGFPYFRHWRAERDVVFPVTITYRSGVEPPSDRRGPPFGIRSSAAGVSGAGSGFLVIPANVTSTVSRVQWDLSDLAADSVAISSFGEGEFELNGPPAALMQGWFMAGPAGRYPDAGDANGFSASWLGDFPFDESAEMEWVGGAYAYLGEFFEYLNPPPRYRVFMRLLDTPPNRGGTALVNSFMLSRGPAEPEELGGEGPRGTFFHEMIHQWVGGVEAPNGVSSWFSEGLTSYYTNLLPMLGGFATVDEYGEGLNEIASLYYSSATRDWSADRIAEAGFANEQARRIPYRRGALYFADLDSRIRASSNGDRNLHVFMRELFEMREQEDFTFDHAKWIELVSAEVGPSAGGQFNDVIIEGALIVPASDAFGPCFERRPRSVTADDGTEFDGYEWIRLTSISDDACRVHVNINN